MLLVTETEIILKLQPGGKMDGIKSQYDHRWHSTQLFWDLMLHMQPDCVTSDIEVPKQAVDLMLDVTIRRSFPRFDKSVIQFLHKCKLEHSNRHLRVLDLRLGIDMVPCGKTPSMLCGNIVPFTCPNGKEQLWARHLRIWKDEKGRSKDRNFKIRHIAGLVRLGDVLTRVYGELLSQLIPGSAAADCAIIYTIVASMDDVVNMFLLKKNYPTTDEL
ncbi:hypothetical protein IL306_012729 [Fusarium sp. DS 682]|nr:hypothetical protein IL306_012729 [Fusarium sp. DS 682]